MQQKSSIAGFNRYVPGGYAYGQSKAAATHLAKQMAPQMVPYDIRANVIAPRHYPSELAWPIIGTGVFPKEKIPAERVGSEEDMAGTILYMTSRAGAYLNGNFQLKHLKQYGISTVDCDSFHHLCGIRPKDHTLSPPSNHRHHVGDELLLRPSPSAAPSPRSAANPQRKTMRLKRSQWIQLKPKFYSRCTRFYEFPTTSPA
ncbi:MAG: hypothetical protein Q9178_002636 [Gyalolechia marmorata]